MTHRIDIPNLDDLIAKYKAGSSPRRLASEAGCSADTLRLRFKERGVEIRSHYTAHVLRRKPVPDIDDMIEEYKSGKPLPVIAKEHKYDVGFLCLRFKEKGIKLRGITDSKRFDRAAITRFEKGRHIHRLENEVANIISNAGFSVSQQFPVGPYNVDVAIGNLPIAVEICHTNATNFNNGVPSKCISPQRRRIKYLLDRGWFVLYIIATGPGYGRQLTINLTLIRNELTAWLKRAYKDKSVFGCYWIIWGNGKAPPVARYDFGQCLLAPQEWAHINGNKHEPVEMD